jgi:hypothetical protein
VLEASQHNLPGAGNEQKGWSNRGFCHAKKEPHRDQATIVPACSRESHDSTPDKRINRKIFCNREPGNEVGSWVFPEKVSEIENTGNPGVLLAFQVLSEEMSV